MDWGRIGNSVEKLLQNQHGLAVEFTWNGETRWGCRSTLRKEAVATMDGLLGDYAFSLLCPYSEFEAARPQPRTDKVVVDGRVYRVLDVETDAVAATLKIHLGGELA